MEVENPRYRKIILVSLVVTDPECLVVESSVAEETTGSPLRFPLAELFDCDLRDMRDSYESSESSSAWEL